MMVLCAWCEQEGRPALLREVESHHSSLPSHGICKAHEEVIFAQMTALGMKDRSRLTLRRFRPSNQGIDRPSAHVSVW
jgi:hypothetical protein